MKKTNRFALLAVLGAVLGSALIMGCGGGAEDDTAATNNTAGAGAADAGEE
jgi:outer membrane murein-binding lipoprotein Lpp